MVVEADRVDQSIFGALKSPSRMSLLLSEERASIDSPTRVSFEKDNEEECKHRKRD